MLVLIFDNFSVHIKYITFVYIVEILVIKTVQNGGIQPISEIVHIVN